MPDPELDIVIVTHNSGTHIEATITSLGPDASVVVIDNASDDDSVERARRAGATVVESDTNAGFAASANRGARLGRSPFILFLNPDARIDRADATRLTDALRADPALTIVSPRLVFPDGSTQRAAWPFPSTRRAWREAVGLHRSRPDRSEDVFVIGAALVVRRAAFDALHGFDERFWLYAEETDLCRRALDAGGGIGIVERAVATHVGGASGADQPGLVFDHFHRGVEHYIAKRDGLAGVISLRAAMAVGSVVRAGSPGPDERRGHHRHRLRHLARAVLTSPFAVPLDSPATRAPGKGLVVCSLEAWDDTWRRNQFFVRELLALDPNRRVLFVEPSFDHVLEARMQRGRRRQRGLRPLDTDARVIRLEPSKVWPRALGPFADRSLQRQVRRAAHRLGFASPSLWVNDPSYVGLVRTARWPSLYDITDDWTEAGAGAHGRTAALVETFERELFASCGAVVVCSDGLARSRRPQRPDLVVIPNAVDAEHFRAPRDRPADLPAGPTAVYVGTLHQDRLDVELVERLASRLDGLSVVLIGPDALPHEIGERLRATPTIEVFGARPYADIPAYLQHADVIIVPHVVSPFTESLDPIKAYECVAVGRPTVATPVAGFRDLPHPVVVASGEAFVDAVEDLVVPRRDAEPGSVPTWAERGRAFEEGLRASRSLGSVARTRVVYVDHCAQLSGAEVALARLLPALDEVEAHVILGEHGPLEHRLRTTGAHVEVLELDRAMATTHRDEVRLGALGARRVVAAVTDTVALARRLRALDPDLVETNSLKAALYGGVAARLAGVPVIWHMHDRIADDYLPAPVVWAIRGLVRCVPSGVIANSEATKSTLGGRRDVVVIPNPLPRPDPPAAPTAAPLPPVPFRAVMVGRLAPWKGQAVFLEAFARSFPDGEERATVVGSALFGEDAYARSLDDLIDRLGIADRVELLGFRDDVDELLGQADVLVHASITPEPFGQVIIEGMAAGVPVLASRGGGPSEIITDGVDGLLHPPGDVAALAAQLAAVATDPDLRSRLAAGGAVRARDFEPRAVAALVHATYARVLERSGR